MYLSAKWYPITFRGDPPRPFLSTMPLSEKFETSQSTQVYGACFRTNRLEWIAREQRQPPTIDIEDSTLQIVCRDMSHLQVDASTEARVETRNSDTQIGDLLPLELLPSVVQVVESALSPTSDARRALSRGLSLDEPLLVPTRRSRHTKAYIQLSAPKSEEAVGPRALRQRTDTSAV